MSAESAEEIQKHKKRYLGVFYALMVLTVVTWAASFLPVGMAAAVMIAMAIAIVKSSLVIGFFMHMIGEKKVIVWAMLLCLTFFAVFKFPLWLIPASAITNTGCFSPTHLSEILIFILIVY